MFLYTFESRICTITNADFSKNMHSAAARLFSTNYFYIDRGALTQIWYLFRCHQLYCVAMLASNAKMWHNLRPNLHAFFILRSNCEKMRIFTSKFFQEEDTFQSSHTIIVFRHFKLKLLWENTEDAHSTFVQIYRDVPALY